MSAPIDQPDYVKPTITAAGQLTTASTLVPALGTIDLFTILGTGKLNYIILFFGSIDATPVTIDKMWWRWVVDGVEQAEIDLLTTLGFLDGVINTPTDILFTGINIALPPSHNWILHMRIPMPFRISLALRIRNSDAANAFAVGDWRWISLIR